MQHAVDAEADPEDLLIWLEVDVGSAAPDGVHEDHVDEPDHRRLVGRFLELEDVDLACRGLLVPLDQLDVRGRALHLRHDVGDAPALAVVRSIDGLPDRRLRGHGGDHLKIRHEAHIVQGEDVGGVAHGERQRIALELDGQDLVFAGDLLRDELEDVGVDVQLGERDRLDPVLAGQEGDQVLFGDEAELDEDATELVVGALLLLQGARELLVVDQSLADEEIAETPADGLWLSGFGVGHREKCRGVS